MASSTAKALSAFKRTYREYAAHYSSSAFWKKAKGAAADAGKKLVRAVLELFYAAKDGDMSAGDRAKVYGALGYFILPIDLWPDMLPGGYADDLAVVFYTYKLLSEHIGRAEKAKATAKMKEWGLA